MKTLLALILLTYCFISLQAQAIIPHHSSDTPFYQYRILHVDVARHFADIDELKVMIDKMSELKFNVLHIHLTDDQGWRIPIDGYDKLITVGAKRVEPDGSTYDKSFSIQELKNLVAYAKTKHVEIMPEIDFPAHFRAGLAAYPVLSCKGTPQIVGNAIYDPKAISTLCVSNPESLKLAKKTIDVLCDVFPFELIHLGGDECDFSHWKTCPKCQALAQSLKLEDTHELQAYFMNTLAEYTHAKGRKMIAWDEQTDFKTPSFEPKPIIMVWRGSNMLPQVLEKGYQAIMAPSDFSYLDYCQGIPSSEPFGDHMRLISNVYQFPTENDSRVIGAGACVWAEEITDSARRQYMMFPRLFVLSEIFYHGNNRLPHPQLMQNVISYMKDYEKQGIVLSASGFQQIPYVNNNSIAFKSELPGVEKIILTSKDSQSRTYATHESIPIPKVKTSFKVENIHASKLPKTTPMPIYFNAYKHLGVNALNAKLSATPSPEYMGQNGVNSLVDGLYLEEEKINNRLHAGHYKHPFYIGYRDLDSEYYDFVFNTKRPISVSKITIPTLHNERSWIMKPEKIELISNGKTVAFLTQDDIAKTTVSAFTLDKKLNLENFTIRITPAKLPKNHYGAGQKAWLFLQEIIIE